MLSRILTRSIVKTTRLRHFTTPTSLNTFTAEETQFRDVVRRFANDKVQPKVKEMDQSATMDAGIIKGLFENGFMAVELESEYGGTGATFTSAIITIEVVTDGAVFGLILSEIRSWPEWTHRLVCVATCKTHWSSLACVSGHPTKSRSSGCLD
jgi:hypothetical protein